MSRSTVAAVALLLHACHPLAPWRPPALPDQQPLVVKSTAPFPARTVKIAYDDLGVPHLFGQHEADLSYGLGFVHARDRGFRPQSR